MIHLKKQVMDICDHTGVSPLLSDEHQRNWSDQRWERAMAENNYDRSRDHLNFEIAKGCVVQPIDKRKSVTTKFNERLAQLHIKDPNEGKKNPKRRTVCNVIFGGSTDHMRTLAFGDQAVDFTTPGVNSHVTRKADIEEWAKDIYRFACEQWGEDNIIGFYCHLDETWPHIHCTMVPIDDTERLSYKRVFHGETKQSYAAYMKMLHDRLAEVNKRWGLERGDSVSITGARHVTTEQYRRKVYEDNRRLEQRNEELDQQIAAKTVTLSDLMTQIDRARKAVKGLTTMIDNLNAKRERQESELDALRKRTATTEAERLEHERQIEEKEMQLSKINEDLADKTAKLEKAEEKLEELKRITSDAQLRHKMMQQSVLESSRSMQGHISAKLAQAGFEEMVNAVSPLLCQLSSEKDAQLFDGTLLKDMAERGNKIFTCASLLFAGYIDQATRIAESCGGGTSNSDLPWRRNDEDDRAWARRCLSQAQLMTRPTQKRQNKARR